MQQNRRLIIIPVVHTRADSGSLGSKIPVNQEYETMAAQYWQAVSEEVRRLPVDFSELRIYQDGLADVSEEMVAKIVNETQTANYDLLRWLRGKGAHIVGTENINLLLQEYRALQAIVSAESDKQRQTARLEYMKVSAFLLDERDKYIAQRIKADLPEGGMGILFIGLAHEVNRLLEQEIEVAEPETLMGRPSEALRNKLFENQRLV